MRKEVHARHIESATFEGRIGPLAGNPLSFGAELQVELHAPSLLACAGGFPCIALAIRPKSAQRLLPASPLRFWNFASTILVFLRISVLGIFGGVSRETHSAPAPSTPPTKERRVPYSHDVHPAPPPPPFPSSRSQPYMVISRRWPPPYWLAVHIVQETHHRPAHTHRLTAPVSRRPSYPCGLPPRSQSPLHRHPRMLPNLGVCASVSRVCMAACENVGSRVVSCLAPSDDDGE